MRLIDYGGEELYGMTPLHGMSWVYDEFFEPWERDANQDVDVRIVVVDMEDNPHLDRVTMARVLKGLSPEERKARKSGRFVSFAGAIYPEFTEGRYVVPALDQLPPNVEVFCGIDPGYRHMCAVLWGYLDDEDDLVIFDELALPQARVGVVAKEIALHNERWDVKPRWYVIDPAARNRNQQTGRSDQSEYQDHGIFTIPGQNAVGAGINHVKERFAADKLHICANCTELISEFPKYRWIKDTTRSESAPAERPVKKDDHALDTLRYIVMARPLKPARDQPKPTDTWKDRALRESLKRLRGHGGRRAAPQDHFAGPGIFN